MAEIPGSDHDSVEFEKQGRPAVTIVTTAFKTAVQSRLNGLGLPDHPTVVTDHPLASRSLAEVNAMAARAVESVVNALVTK